MNLKYTAFLLAIAPAFAFAQGANTITFQGEINASTCSVAINGVSANPTVLIPTISTAALNEKGKFGPTTTFAIGVTGCTAPTTADQAINTTFVGNNVTSGGNLLNTGKAKGVSLQLLDGTGTTGYNLTGGYTATGLVLPKGETTATHNFGVRYIAEGTDAVAPGSVIGSVQYSVAYP
ncbi:fimbrial protein [Solimicrobium silvestre]|uniref:P pilus assembly protein pilin FimA n=1 Tax=Solimicrobium silvestre TaxID=2099400 RepID=A0A2S9H1G5_9BURK|nr:fimbrial protein [Solimicrobium silvestre]PRC93783.1 P pilus assembly protein pilin FimA [Solimicrobium silvestre]